jgi:putative endonuclease
MAGPGDDAARKARGREAERLAAEYLEDRGLRVVDRNHAIPRGEVDLVCEEGDGDVLCFVEVRSRSSEAQGGPEETVDRRKRRRVVAAAVDWAMRHDAAERTIRFDVVAVTFGDGAPRIEHFPAAFDADAEPWHG